jgi:hypothetical protein
MEALTIWAKRLQDPNPQVRLKAVQELETIGTPEALILLSDVFAQDGNADVRQAAQTVGKHIYYRLTYQRQAESGASEEERRRASEILAKAQARKGRT